jgi:hypothetical protein
VKRNDPGSGIEVTDMNEVIFDARNDFRGCIPGIHEVLRRQGLLYPHHTDNEFVKSFLEKDEGT